MISAEIKENGYEKLLACLDGDPVLAVGKFEELRRKLLWLFGWWGAQFPEDLADETLARVAKNLARGEVVNNLIKYCNGVAKNVWREQLKAPQYVSIDDDFQELSNNGDEEDAKNDTERRAQCLDDCLSALPPESRYLITEYYCCGGAQLIERRRQLSKQFGLAREALANRAQRLRHRLEECIIRCERKNQRHK
jgi:RNA polymerase sigma factor (sigma-70 family)